MNSYERVSLALKREEPDRVPITTFSNIKNKNLSTFLTNYILKNADAQYELYMDEFSYLSFPGIGIDLNKREIKNQDRWIEHNYTNKNGTKFNEIFKYGEDGLYRSYKKHIITDTRDIYSILALPYIKPEKNNAFKAQINSFYQDTKNHNNNNEFCMFVINNPLSFICANTDPQNILIWTITERKLIKEYLDEILKRELEYLEYALKENKFLATFMIGGAEFAIPPLMSPGDFDDFVLEYDKKIIDLIHSYKKQVIVHCHGKINNFIPKFIQMGADGIHPLEPIGPTGDCDLKAVKDRYGSDICLIGNIQYEDFSEGTSQDMESKVKQLMDMAKEDGGFILSPACPFFHSQMPEKIEGNIKTYIDAGLKYGKYLK